MILVTFGQFELEKLAIFRKRNEGKPTFRNVKGFLFVVVMIDLPPSQVHVHVFFTHLSHPLANIISRPFSIRRLLNYRYQQLKVIIRCLQYVVQVQSSDECLSSWNTST